MCSVQAASGVAQAARRIAAGRRGTAARRPGWPGPRHRARSMDDRAASGAPGLAPLTHPRCACVQRWARRRGCSQAQPAGLHAACTLRCRASRLAGRCVRVGSQKPYRRRMLPSQFCPCASAGALEAAPLHGQARAEPVGMATSVTAFSRIGRTGRGDTSAWTDTPLLAAQRASHMLLEHSMVRTPGLLRPMRSLPSLRGLPPALAVAPCACRTQLAEQEHAAAACEMQTSMEMNAICMELLLRRRRRRATARPKRSWRGRWRRRQ